MVKVKENLVGIIFGKLTVLEQTEDVIDKNGKHISAWLCECNCENKSIVIKTGRELKTRKTPCCDICKNNVEFENGRFKRSSCIINLDGDYGIGYTQKGEEFWFDKEDVDIVKDKCWHYSNKGYVQTTDRETHKTVKLHRLIMGVTDPLVQVDHKNHPPRHEHKKDNRKSNLEIVTQSKNSQNRSLALNNTSGVVGVSWNKREQSWKAYIKINQKQIHLGTFTNKEDAIKARKDAEIKYFGEYRYDARN